MLVDLGPVDVSRRTARACGAVPPPASVAGVRRVVAQLVVLDQLPERRRPGSRRRRGRARSAGRRTSPRCTVGVAPVEVGLLGEERVAGSTGRWPRPTPRPRRRRSPASCWAGAPSGRGVAPDVPVALGVVARGARLQEPRVLVGGVVRDEVEDHPQAARVRGRDQRVEVGERAEQRVDVAVVGDVVAEVGHRRGVDRREPDGVDAQPASGSRGAASDARAGRRRRRRRCPGSGAGRSGRRRRRHQPSPHERPRLAATGYSSAVSERQPLVPPPLRLPAPLREYLREEAAGGVVLMVAAVVALGMGELALAGRLRRPCGRPAWPSSSAASPSRPTCATGSTTA